MSFCKIRGLFTGEVFTKTLLSTYYLTFYIFKFPSHYGFQFPFDFSYLFLITLCGIGLTKGFYISKSYAYFVVTFFACMTYALLFSYISGAQAHQSLSLWLEGREYFSRSDIAWITSLIAQFMMFCIIPPIFGRFSMQTHNFALRIFLIVNSYFAILQVGCAYDPELFAALPLKIGLYFDDGVNLSFGRAVGLTSANGAFYFSFGMLSAVLVLVALNLFRPKDSIFILISTLSLSRSAILVALVLTAIILIKFKVRVIWCLSICIGCLICALALINSSLWHDRMTSDVSAQVRSEQLMAVIQLFFENPLGIGGNHNYFFDSSVTAVIAEYGLPGIMGFILLFFVVYNMIKPAIGSLQAGLVLLMGLISFSLTGSPLAYLPNLFVGMFLYFISTKNPSLLFKSKFNNQ